MTQRKRVFYPADNPWFLPKNMVPDSNRKVLIQVYDHWSGITDVIGYYEDGEWYMYIFRKPQKLNPGECVGWQDYKWR